MIPRVRAEKIMVTANGRLHPILSEITFSIFEKEFIVVLGHNGSGKSTLVKVLSGELLPTSGSVFIDDKPIKNISASKKSIDVLTLTQKPEDRLFLDMTLRENIALWESRLPLESRLEVKKILNLTNAPLRLLNKLEQPVRSLSGGEKQSLLLSLVLAHPPRVLFLDEHTSSLDPKASEEVMIKTAKAIDDHKITALMVTHDLEDAIKYGNRLIILREGRVVVDQKKSEGMSIRELKEMME